VNFSDPFGLKVCFGERNRTKLKEGLEDATNTEITLDDDGCVEGFVAREGKGFRGLQKRLQRMIDREEVYGVEDWDGIHSNWPTEQTVRINIARIEAGQSYPINIAGVCSNQPGFGNVLTSGGLLAHELLGHAYHRGGSERRAMRAENAYLAGRGMPRRACYRGQ
jgi:hypothetical protein